MLGAIAAGGFEARVVGGAVRNALMGLPVTDIDLATTASPAEVVRLASASGLATFPTGLAHGTITVLADGHPFEVTTLRTDVESDGRHATVAFTTDWASDAGRRDFTINALYCRADGTVDDPLGGYPDLAARRVRFIGDAASRIREDYLRILRFFRFTAQYSGGSCDADGLAACVRERAGIARLSGERLRQEMLKLLVAPRVLEQIEAMREHGVLAVVLPVAPRPTLLARLIEIETALALPPKPALRLAALGVETEEDARRLTDRLRLSAGERERLLLAPQPEAHLTAPPDSKAARALLYDQGPSAYRGLLTLAWARALASKTSDPAWSDAVRLAERWPVPVFAIKGADVLRCDVAPGPRVGVLLRALETWWVAEDFRPDRTELLAQLAARCGFPRGTSPDCRGS